MKIDLDGVVIYTPNMLITQLVLNKKGIPYRTQRISYSCDECSKKIESSYYVYLRKKNKKDYCASCKQKGELAPNFGMIGEKNYFYGKQHSYEAKKKISETKIGEVYSIQLPNKSFPFLEGALQLRTSDNGAVCFQKLKRNCKRCNKIDSIDFTTCRQFELCRRCTILIAESWKVGIVKWQQENKELVIARNRIATRKIEGRIKRSCKAQGISIDQFKSFKTLPRNQQDFFVRKDKYTAWRTSIFERDNYSCKFPDCMYCHNKRGGIVLAAHHIYPKAKFPEQTFDLNNGITVCDSVHKKVLNGRELKYVDTLLAQIKYE